jgi:hypothetical protein
MNFKFGEVIHIYGRSKNSRFYRSIFTLLGRFADARFARLAFKIEGHEQQEGSTMTARAKLPVYRIYLLTVWQAQGQAKAGEAEWRFHVTDPHTGKRYGFANAEGLIAALQQLANDQRPANEVS